MIATDFEILTDLMNTLADARAVLNSVLSRFSDAEQALRESVEITIRDIDSVRLKGLKLALDKDLESPIFQKARFARPGNR
jgi:hypothetical protein